MGHMGHGFSSSSIRSKMAFAPARLFFGQRLLTSRPYVYHRTFTDSRSSFSAPRAVLRARERRREADHARIIAHHQLKQEIDQRREDLLSAIVSISPDVRKRCRLTHRMSRVKVFLEPNDLTDVATFRNRVRLGLTRLFPELEEKGLLGVSDGFDLRVAGSSVIQDLRTLQSGVERCERAGSPLYVEVIPHNAPPPKPPLSSRVGEVKAKAEAAAADCDQQLYMISFYKFIELERPELVAGLLERAWKWMGVKGRIYVAAEGVNAQLAVPAATIHDFEDAMRGNWIERGESIIPDELVGVYLNKDKVVHNKEQPFEKLNVRPREKILADGFEKPLDWNKSGREVPPEEWHTILSEKKDDVVLLDCRNDYESDVGRFEDAEPLNTNTFRESWDQLEKRLQGEDRNKQILTYCTGGIRCVKVNAFLEQKLGFTNTGRLQGGIVSYAKTLRENGKLDESKFKGVNHVFDGRMGEVITEDLLERCINCGQLCNVQSDCANTACPRSFDKRIFVQCENCTVRLQGACSEHCHHVIESSSERSKNVREVSKSEEYADAFSMPESSLLKEVRETTIRLFERRAHMLSSHAQASLMSMLLRICGGTRVLEIGTFTGYATLALAGALPTTGKIITIEMDPKVAEVAKGFFERDLENGNKIEQKLGAGKDVLDQLVASQAREFDLIFVDADKGGYEGYTRTILENDLLRTGGIILFDNVLFRGEVASLWEDDKYSEGEPDLVRQRLRNMTNVQKIASKLHKFNSYLQEESRLEQVVLPFRDGLTVARRK